MKLPLSWVRDYVEISAPVEEIAHRLTMCGLEVEKIDRVEQVAGVIIGNVVDCGKHPNADKLSICKVNTGQDTISIVCGAPNVKKGIKVPVALVGTKLSNGMVIKKAKIRGLESNGMICSEKELEISEESSGIMILPDSCKTGSSLWQEIPSREPVLEIAITPNRGDCLSIIGLARELAAVYNTKSELSGQSSASTKLMPGKHKVKYPVINLKETEINTLEKIKIEIEDIKQCPRYVGRYLKNIKFGHSPEWMQQRLLEAGMRPINNIVDITNYVMLETGQPLHAFDYKKLEKGEIHIRLASENEKFTTLDDKEHNLSKQHLLICDANKPVAIAGIMGGKDSEVDETTTEILLESAHFNPVTIRIGAKKLGISTESSFRFERVVDPNGCARAADRAAELMAMYCNAEIGKGCVDVYPENIPPKNIRLRKSRVNRVLGTDISVEILRKILEQLEITVLNSSNNEFDVQAPTFRPDLEREIDLIEEIARIYGYENIPPKTSSTIHFNTDIESTDKLARNLRQNMVGLGFCEVYCNSLVDPKENICLWVDEKEHIPVRLLNPQSPELAALRTSLVSGLLKVAKWNSNRNIKDLQIFEIGKSFLSKGENKLPLENDMIAGLVMGNRFLPGWYGEEKHNFSSAKGLLQTMLQKISLDKIEFKTFSSFNKLLDGESVEIFQKKAIIGYLGTVNKKISDKYDLREPVFIFELKLSALMPSLGNKKTFRVLPKFPPIDRDFAFVFNKNIESELIKSHIYKISSIIEHVEWFDLYMGEQIEKGKKSMALSVRMRSDQKTLTDTEAEKLSKKIIDSIKKEFGGEIRK